MIFVGIDPSFLHSGVTVIDTDTKTLSMNEFGVEINKKSTLNIFSSIPVINIQIIRYLDNIKGDKSIGIEVSRSITAWMATELYALDYDLFQRVFMSTDTKSLNIYSNASLSKSLLGHKSSEKEKTIYLVEDTILPVFEKHGYAINKQAMTKTKFEKNEKGRWTYKDTITDGCADSMIYALRQFILYGKDKELKQDILGVLPRLVDMKEMD